jgi:hypothetical protein
MNRRIAVVSLLAILLVSGFVYLHQGEARPASSSFQYESGLFLLNPSDYLKVNLANVDTIAHSYRVVVFGTTNGAPLNTVLDTGTLAIPAGQGMKAEYFVPSTVGGNDYGVEITVDSDTVISTVAVFGNCPNNACPAGSGPRYWQAGAQLTKFRQ